MVSDHHCNVIFGNGRDIFDILSFWDYEHEETSVQSDVRLFRKHEQNTPGIHAEILRFLEIRRHLDLVDSRLSKSFGES